jgi:acetylcholinesterase
MQDQYPGLADKDAKIMAENYPIMAALPYHASWFPTASLAYGESTFICPSNAILNTLASSVTNGTFGSKIWSWRYNVFDQDAHDRGMGVVHVFDAPAIFGPRMLPSDASYFSYNAGIVPVMMNYVISFVRTLDPNTYRYAAAPVWRPWGSVKVQERLVVEMGNSHMEGVSDGQRRRCGFWEGVARVTRQKR